MDLLNGQDIAQVLGSEGPVVKCVLLRARNDDNDERKQSAKPCDAAKDLHVNLMEELQVDTTPKKQIVSQILGGPFTFLGQYEEEGIVLMMKRVQQEEMPLNPHKLQPPFDECEIRGDVLIMKVAPTEEVLDEDGDSHKELEVPSNQEFFLDYSKEEYITFASRTDIVAPELPQEEEEEEHMEEEVQSQEEKEESDGEDEEYNVLEDGSDEEDQVGFMNLIMGQVLRKFREENGRGPDTRELLTLRSALAEKMGVPLPDVDEADWDQKAVKKKRETIEPCHDGNSPVKSILTRKRTVEKEEENVDANEQEAKKVKFSNSFEADESSEKPAALPETEKALEVTETKAA